jgi:hypothetical protein
MAYEQVILGGVRQIDTKKGKMRLLRVSIKLDMDIFLNEEHIPFIPQFEQFQGQEVLIPVRWRMHEGRPSLNFDGDPRILPAAALPTNPASAPSDSSALSSATLASKLGASASGLKTGTNG